MYMGSGGEEVILQIHLKQGVQGIDHHQIGIQIQHPVQLPGKIPGGEDPVIHLLGIPVGDRRIRQKLPSHLDGQEPAAPSGSPAAIASRSAFSREEWRR